MARKSGNTSIASQIKATIIAVKNAIVTAVKSLASNISSAVKTIAKAIWHAIKTAARAIWHAIKTAAKFLGYGLWYGLGNKNFYAEDGVVGKRTKGENFPENYKGAVRILGLLGLGVGLANILDVFVLAAKGFWFGSFKHFNNGLVAKIKKISKERNDRDSEETTKNIPTARRVVRALFGIFGLGIGLRNLIDIAFLSVRYSFHALWYSLKGIWYGSVGESYLEDSVLGEPRYPLEGWKNIFGITGLFIGLRNIIDGYLVALKSLWIGAFGKLDKNLAKKNEPDNKLTGYYARSAGTLLSGITLGAVAFAISFLLFNVAFIPLIIATASAFTLGALIGFTGLQNFFRASFYREYLFGEGVREAAILTVGIPLFVVTWPIAVTLDKVFSWLKNLTINMWRKPSWQRPLKSLTEMAIVASAFAGVFYFMGLSSLFNPLFIPAVVAPFAAIMAIKITQIIFKAIFGRSRFWKFNDKDKTNLIEKQRAQSDELKPLVEKDAAETEEILNINPEDVDEIQSEFGSIFNDCLSQKHIVRQFVRGAEEKEIKAMHNAFNEGNFVIVNGSESFSVNESGSEDDASGSEDNASGSEDDASEKHVVEEHKRKYNFKFEKHLDEEGLITREFLKVTKL